VTSEPPFLIARPGLRDVYEWALEQHAGQRRDLDRAPFILHPLEVASLLAGRDFDDAVVAAALLHDTIENTGATVETIRTRFGDRVAAIVAAVSEDPTITDFAQRKAALATQAVSAGPDAQAVYAADKVVKARELRARLAREPEALTNSQVQDRLDHYEHSLDVLRIAAHDSPFVAQLAFELWALRALPPR
jgi:(p)ppGpp synthase/HD superfamily hydrolase